MPKVVTFFVVNVVVLVAVAFLAVAPESAYADGCSEAYSGGDGMTVITAYLISKQGDLEALARDRTCDAGDYFRQTKDINLTGETWAPIGSESVPFQGLYDGGGHRITGLTFGALTTSYTGFFGVVNGAEIHDLTIVNPSMGDGVRAFDSIGVLAGQAASSAITNVNVVGATITLSKDEGFVGGLIGWAVQTTIDNSSVSGTIDAGSSTGGLVGLSCASRIAWSMSTVVVTGSSYVGGLGGQVTADNCLLTPASTITCAGINMCFEAGVFDSHATGDVSGINEVGGLVGWIVNTPVKRSFATGSVTGTLDTGGLIGLLYGTSITTDTYARGRVSGSSQTGGLVGGVDPNAVVENSYATGHVTGSDSSGGLVGVEISVGTIAPESAFWDSATTGQASSLRGAGKTTAEMKAISTFTNAGWSIATGRDLSKVWGICGAVNDGYPFLINTYAGTTDPCEIADLEPSVPPVTLRVTSTAAQGTSIATRLHVSGAGKITQVGTLKGTKAVVCRAKKRPTRAGYVNMVCTMNAATQARLLTKRVKVVLVTTFTSASGTVVRRQRTVTMARIVVKPIAVTG